MSLDPERLVDEDPESEFFGYDEASGCALFLLAVAVAAVVTLVVVWAVS